MRGGLLFFGMALVWFGLATHGLFSDGVIAVQRHSRHVILRADQPYWYAVTILAYGVAGVLFTGIATFLFWLRRKEQEAERRFRRSRQFLE